MSALEVADVFRQFGRSYLDAFGDRILPSHRRAINDIIACRTEAMGGHMYECKDCGETFFVYHGCGNRACPACHKQQTQKWLDARAAQLLPCPYFHVSVTVPAQLREVFRANQKDCYGLLMKASAEAVKTLCAGPRYMGATPSILVVLHSWTAAMDYHPHVHLLVSGGGIGEDGVTWREAKRSFLVPVRALSLLVRGKFHALLEKERPDLIAQIPEKVWNMKWVAWCKSWGEGQTAVLDYLARYVHRIAITSGRILAMDENTVTFRYKHRKSAQWRTCTVTGHEFIRRFLQHVPPKGFHKVRYYGLWHCASRAKTENARNVLLLRRPQPAQAQAPDVSAQDAQREPASIPATACPHCGSTATIHLREIPRPFRPSTRRRRRRPPSLRPRFGT